MEGDAAKHRPPRKRARDGNVPPLIDCGLVTKMRVRSMPRLGHHKNRVAMGDVVHDRSH